MPTMLASVRRRLASDRGAISFLNLLILAFLAGCVYYAAAWVPHWLRNREVISVMHEAGYRAWREKNDRVLLQSILKRTDEIVQVDGTPVIDESQVRIGRTDSTIHIQIEYEVPMRFPGTKKVQMLSFENAVAHDLTNPRVEDK